MKYLSVFFRLFFVYLFTQSFVYAIDTGNRKTTLDFRVKQGASAAYDLANQSTTNGPTNFLLEASSSYRPNRSFTFVGNFWLRGDIAPHLQHIRADGLRDSINAPAFPTGGAGSYLNNLPFKLHEEQCNRNVQDPFCSDSDELKLFDNFDEIIRELSVKYRSKNSLFSMKLGKFQRGWGQSDGLRLLDVLHAQDLRERFAFRDSDELRIPAWMGAFDFNIYRTDFGKAINKLGIKRATFEFNVVPEVHTSRFIINNPTPSDQASGGIFGLPFPALRDPLSNKGLARLGANLSDNKPKDFSFDDAEYSARLKFDSLGGTFTLNGFYGKQDLPVVKFTGANGLVGNALNNEDAATSITTFNAEAGINAYHNVYLPCLRTATGCAGLGTIQSLNANFQLDYDYRQQLVGFSFTRDMSEIKIGPKNTSPTLRFELGHEFDKPFNRSRLNAAQLGLSGVQDATGHNALIAPSATAITESDVTSIMIGFDYPLWIPGWDTQEKSIFTSFQFFNIHTYDADEGLLAQAPYDVEVAKDQQYATFLWNAPLHQQRLVLEGLYIHDFDNDGHFYRQRVDFNYFGPNWRPRLEWIHFDGNGKQTAPIGIFDNSDIVELSVTYQF